MPGIPCPLCESTLSDVLESRPREGFIRRRRKCFNGHTFSTREIVAEEAVKPEGPTLTERIRAMLRDGKSVSETALALDSTTSYVGVIARREGFSK